MFFFFLATFLSFFYLQMSQKNSTFALVIELERHIEILLLSNDCVVVPDLGGFVTHYREAYFDDEDNMFLPPLRTLGFNPQLNMNDSLLAQSYIEAYDISYPEAVRRIEAEVAELKLHLSSEGEYELNDIGVLSINEEGKMEFEPCEAGILTPAFYGLSSFEMLPKYGAKTISKLQRPKQTIKTIEEPQDEDIVEETATEEKEETITIQMSWVRNTVAVAAALLAFFMMTPRIDNGGQPEVSMSQMTLPIMTKDTPAKPMKKLDAQAIKTAINECDTATADVVIPAADMEKAEKPAATPAQATQKTQPSTTYCIVVASQVSQHNAEAFVKILQQEGIDNVRVNIHNGIRRVIYGSYTTETEAYRQLQDIRQHERLRDAWVYKLN